MSYLKTLYAKVRDHFIKIVGTFGAVFLTLDLTILRGFADSLLGSNAAQKVGIVLFVLATIRAWYVTWAQRKS